MAVRIPRAWMGVKQTGSVVSMNMHLGGRINLLLQIRRW